MAGYRELLAVEWMRHAGACFKLNFPDVKLFCGDIGKLSDKAALAMAEVKTGELDVLDGSPPCQGFSTAGKRKLGDSRSRLFEQYCRLLNAFAPKVFVMENVSGMVKGKMKIAFAEIFAALESCGYTVSCRLMNSCWFAVPQRRERVIFVGVRNDLNMQPAHPLPQFEPITAARAIINCEIDNDLPKLKGKYGSCWHKVKPGSNYARTFKQASGFNGCAKIDPRKPAPTLPAMQGGEGFGTIVHWSESRPIAISEAKRFGSFPDQFRLCGKYQLRWKVIGNSVPPLLMKAIADHIRENILCPNV